MRIRARSASESGGRRQQPGRARQARKVCEYVRPRLDGWWSCRGGDRRLPVAEAKQGTDASKLPRSSEPCDGCEKDQRRHQDHLQRKHRAFAVARRRRVYGRPGCAGQRQRIPVGHVGERHRLARLIDRGREDEREILTADRGSGNVVEQFPQRHGLAQCRAGRAGIPETQGSGADLVKRPGFGRSIAEGLRRGEATFQAYHQALACVTALEQRATAEPGPTPGLSGVCCAPGAGFLQRRPVSAHVPIRSCSEQVMARCAGCLVVRPASVRNTIGEPVARLTAAHETAPGQRLAGKRRQFGMLPRAAPSGAAGSAGQRAKRPPLLFNDRHSNSAMRVAGEARQRHRIPRSDKRRGLQN